MSDIHQNLRDQEERIEKHIARITELQNLMAAEEATLAKEVEKHDELVQSLLETT